MADRPVAIVTGGSRGIGRGIALELARLGYDLVIAHLDFDDQGRPDDSKGLETRTQARDLGAECEVRRADVSHARDRKALVELARSTLGRCNMLVNNAGVAPSKRLDLLEATEESFDRVMNINLKGPYFLTQAVANWMIEQRQGDPDYEGCIINVSSISATVASPSRGEYCISKAGVSMATQLWAVRLGEYGIPVYEVRPGVTMTDMTKVVKEKYDKLIAEGLTVQPRWSYPEDVGKAVAMLARRDLAYSTGQVIMVDGGLTLARL